MKKNLIIVLLIMALMLSGCNKKKTEVQTEPNNTTEATVAATIEETVPGSAISIFDEDGNVLPEHTVPDETTASTEPKETKPAATVPQSPSGTGNSNGLYEPDEPDTSDPEPTKGTEPTKPTEKEPDPTKPTEKEPVSNSSNQSEYEKFQAMTPAEQQAKMESFGDIAKFFEWYENAKAEYDAANPPIKVEDGTIDLDKIINGSN